VTGSNGKTTTKEMLSHILAGRMRVAGAVKSYNNAIGVPLTLLGAGLDADALVVEAGTNHPGEIDALAAIIRPDIAVITHVGPSHLEGLGDEAEAFARGRGLEASSAGTIPPSAVNPVVVQAMKEKGVDIASNRPKMLTTQMIKDASLVVTMGCSVEEACPRPMLAQMQKKLVDWDLEDPKGKPLEQVRRIRDEIERRVNELSKGGYPDSSP
jgi:protein-tyrosine-phosphatase